MMGVCDYDDIRVASPREGRITGKQGSTFAVQCSDTTGRSSPSAETPQHEMLKSAWQSKVLNMVSELQALEDGGVGCWERRNSQEAAVLEG